jgi:hypothetical protein
MSEEVELELLVPDIKRRAVYKSFEDLGPPRGTPPFVYGEHVKGCNHPFDGKTSGLGWEWWDAEPGKKDKCWRCGGPVPKEIVALVALMNWKEMDQSDKIDKI